MSAVVAAQAPVGGHGGSCAEGTAGIEPFLKWPGGKRWLASRIIPLLPRTFDRYIEPFVGSGAMFFRIAPSHAVLADANADLINAYRQIRRYPERIHQRLMELNESHSTDFYYEMRAKQPKEVVDRAVQFLYLNRTCFNGIYRVNRAGRFNVPIGSKTEVAFAPGYLKAIARHLRMAKLQVADFERTIDGAHKGDFVFVDPPYTVMHNENGFVKYNAHLFSWDDQLRLASAARRAVRRGAAVMIANANHESLRRLYRGFGTQRVLGRATVLAANPSRRGKTSELLITSY